MKKNIIAGIALAFTLVSTSSAQSLNAEPGKTATELFRTDVDYTIGGLDFDSSQNAYFLLQSATDTTKLVRRNAADNYSTPTTLFDFGATVYGSFVRIDGPKIYFGESSSWNIRTFDLNTSTASLLATVIGNYDLAIGGGFGWLSANPVPLAPVGENEIVKLNLSTGATTTVLTSSDYSGPVAMDETGALFYGANQYGAGGDIFKYTAAELALGGLTLDAAHKFIENVNNSSLSYNQSGPFLFTSDYSSIFRENVGLTPGTETWATSSNSIGYLSNFSDTVFAGVTDYTNTRSAVFAVVPEPATTGLLGLSAFILGLRRRQK